MTMPLSRHCEGTYQETRSLTTQQGTNSQPQLSRLAASLWTNPGVELVCGSYSPQKQQQKSAGRESMVEHSPSILSSEEKATTFYDLFIVVFHSHKLHCHFCLNWTHEIIKVFFRMLLNIAQHLGRYGCHLLTDRSHAVIFVFIVGKKGEKKTQLMKVKFVVEKYEDNGNVEKRNSVRFFPLDNFVCIWGALVIRQQKEEPVYGIKGETFII